MIVTRAEFSAFAFIEMTQVANAEAAIAALNGMLPNERALRVNEARPKLHIDPTRAPATGITGIIKFEIQAARAARVTTSNRFGKWGSI